MPISVRVVDLNTGTYDLVLSPSLESVVPGRYELHVTLDRADIKGSPIVIQIADPPAAPRAVPHECVLSSVPAAAPYTNTLSLSSPVQSAPAIQALVRDAAAAPLRNSMCFLFFCFTHAHARTHT